MSNDTLKITAEVAEAIRARVKSLDFGAIEKIKKADTKNGTFDVIVSTEDTDRSGEIVRQNGWELSNYKNNPIVLWGHDYYSLPVGVCTETYLTEKNGVPALGARGVFLSADINPFAQQVRKLYEFGLGKGEGVGCTTSVGFIPKEFDEQARNVITKAELLEFSFVPIPANQGVGPAAGRALTFDEAKELQLDVTALKTKGLEFTEVQEKECKGVGVCEDGECDHGQKGKKEAQAGDACTTDDGSPGVLTTDPKDPDGALVCLPQDEDKGFKAEENRASQKTLIKALHEEHERHTSEVEDAFDDFRDKAAGDGKAMGEALKDLRASLADEHTMHRAKAIALFRSFNPAEDKAFNKKEHLKALRGEHEGYDEKCMKGLDDFEERCMKSVQGEPGSVDEHTDWITGRMDENQKAHKKSVTKIAKAMCKDAFGEEDQADEKVLAILNEHLKAYVPEALQRAVFQKVGARISAATREKIAEMHQHMKAATAIAEDLHGGLRNDDGEESRSDGDGKLAPATAPKKQRSRPAKDIQSDELNAHLLSKDILRGVVTAAQRGLEQLNKKPQQ
jgi:hypothetical protein